MSKPAVIIVGADKGGVGKTTITRTLLDYFSARKVPTRAFDTESPKGTLKRFHPDVTDVLDVTKVADQMQIFDTLSDSTVTIIDVRAGLLSPTLTALRDIGFIDAAKKGQITFSVFHILGPSIAFRRIKDAVEITIPKLNEMASEQVELASVPFLSFIANKGADGENAAYSFVLRGYVRHWLGHVWAEYDRIKLVDIVSPKDQVQIRVAR
jgi:GTPase SAR1 family protein